MATWLDIVTEALAEIGVVAGGESASADDADYALKKANRLLDRWNAERQAVYCDTFTSYVLTPNLAPHTIGPSGTLTATVRPVDIPAANLVVTTSTPNDRTPLNIRDSAWWMANSVRAITSPIPTDLFYRPNWPNGELNLWPVPTAAYSLEIQTRVLLSATVALTTTFTLPPGYQDAITLSLAEECCTGAFGRPMPDGLPQRAAKARGIVWANNDEPPYLRTADAGMASSGRGTKLNWQNRQIV
jgi:hypothetical protein